MSIHHIEINVTNLARSFDFYLRFFDFIGYRRAERKEKWFIFHFDTFYLHANECLPEYAGHGFHRYRPGLNHLAFRAASREQIDAWHRVLVEEGTRVLDPPAYYGEQYYAVYFEDPDGIKLELASSR